MTKTLALAAAGLLLAGCSTVPSYTSHPKQTADGRLGFSVRGIASYTRDEAKASDDVRRVLEGSCQGSVEGFQIVFQDASSAAGVPHLAYTASATCRD